MSERRHATYWDDQGNEHIVACCICGRNAYGYYQDDDDTPTCTRFTKATRSR